MTPLQYLLNLAPTLDNLKSFQWTRNSWIFNTLINCSSEIFKENLATNFDLIAVFVKVVYEITALRFTDSHFFFFFSKSRKSTCVQPVVECIKVICKKNE